MICKLFVFHFFPLSFSTLFWQMDDLIGFFISSPLPLSPSSSCRVGWGGPSLVLQFSCITAYYYIILDDRGPGPGRDVGQIQSCPTWEIVHY
jgi:hypothetical protein